MRVTVDFMLKSIASLINCFVMVGFDGFYNVLFSGANHKLLERSYCIVAMKMNASIDVLMCCYEDMNFYC